MRFASVVSAACLVLASTVTATTTILGNGIAETTYGWPDVLAAYSLANPSVSFDMGSNIGPNNRLYVETGVLDFGLTSGAMIASEAAMYPNVTFLPLIATAIVPVYRLDSIVSNVSLIFSLPTLANIYAGFVTNWNDILIREDNPGVNMPNQSITVVFYGEARYITDIWIRALNRAVPAVASILPTPTSGLSWPRSSYAAYRSGIGITGTAAEVVDADGSIGYCIQAAAVATGANVARMINIYGSVVSANTLSVSFTVSEREVQYIPNPLLAVPDLTGCTSMPCWPIVETIFIFIENNIAPRGCEEKSALIQFVEFFYSSTALTTNLLAEYQMVNMPADVQSQLDVGASLSQITCLGLPLQGLVVTAEAVLPIAVPALMTEFITAEANFYQLVDESFVFGVQPAGPAEGAQLIEQGLVVANFFYPTEISAYEARTSTTVNLNVDSFYQLPMFLTSIALVYNPVLSSMLNSLPTTYELVVSADLIAEIMLGDITSWQSDKWLEYNAWLPIVLLNISVVAPVTFVLGCMETPGQSPMTSRLFDWILKNIVDTTVSTRFQNAFGYTSTSAIATLFWSCQQNSTLLPTLLFSASENSHQQLVNSRPGSISFVRDTIDATTGKFSLIYQGTMRSSLWSGLWSCVASGLAARNLALEMVADSTTNTSCWPLVEVLSVQIAKDFGTEYLTAWRVLSWLQTMVNSSAADYWSSSTMILRIPQDPAMEAAITTVLYAVVANGQTVIVTWPIVWELSSSIQVFGTVVVVVGAIFCGASIAFFLVLRNYKTIRSNSPMFMCQSLVGILILLAAIQLLVTNPTDSTCSGVTWTIMLGFQMTFMPLFAKAWRLYRIFGGRKLQVVKINSRKLSAIVGVGLAVELIYLIIWQAVAPTTALTVVQFVNNREHDYVQCGYQGTSLSFFIGACVSKAVLVLVGVRMAFGTRQVSDEFSETMSIAIAIYNLVIAVGLIAALVLLLDTVGDMLILLLVFCCVWVSMFTMMILVVPRILAFVDSRRIKGFNNSVRRFTTSQNSSTGEYSFMSVNMLNNISIAMNYMQSLKHHMNDVETKVASLRAIGTTMPKIKEFTCPATVAPKPSTTVTPPDA